MASSSGWRGRIIRWGSWQAAEADHGQGGHGQGGHGQGAMSSSAAGRPVPAFLSHGFRPFFLAAAIWSMVALALWVAMLAGKAAVPSRFDPLAWHVHEMLFGFVMAAIAGFL